MTRGADYHCRRCDARNYTLDGQLPPAWRQDALGPLCEDCARTLAEPAVADVAAPARYERCETAIRLLSGGYLDLADPDCRVVAPIDIAAGMRNPRFSAQTRDFYMVAQHSLLVLQLVGAQARALGGEKGLQLRRCALMHDATEAFLHDITRPLKIQLPDYRRVEARMDTRLQARFGWDWTDWRRQVVKAADLQALAIEQRDLIGDTDAWPVLDGIDRAPLEAFRITRVWHPEEAMDRFLTAFAELFPANLFPATESLAA